jgi:cytochrome c-type biogenesis protein CcsB
MVFYWVQTVFFWKKQSSTKRLIEWLAPSGMALASISLFCLLSLRWFNSGHFPLSNLYESLIFLSWCFTGLHFLLETRSSSNNYARPFLGAITSSSALFLNAFATLSLPDDMQHSAPLVPALQSNWLMMHVTVMILSYATLLCGSLLSIAFLILYRIYETNPKNKPFSLFETTKLSTKLASFEASFEVNSSFEQVEEPLSTPQRTTNSVNIENKPPLNPTNQWLFKEKTTESLRELMETFDSLSYRILGLGFPFLTIGILSGAVWANEAWGSYWSWDPKETWALLTWLVFAIYLHTRISKGWTGEKPAIIASCGFFVVWICYLGVNLMGEGLHSYGWIHS